MTSVLVVAGTSSNVGKTTVTCSLMAAFTSLGFTVQPFKVGPDFLDGKHHEAACNITKSKERRFSINLDGWMMGGKQQVLESFHRHAAGADIAIVEGVMGLFDGKDGVSEEGSTAQVAKWLGAPVVLVVDASCMARSTAAMVLGYKEFDPALRFGGLVVNKVNGSKHKEWIQEALTSHSDRLRDVGTDKPILFVGAMPQDKSIAIPERHLGLELPQEHDKECFVKLAAMAKANLDINGLMELACTATTPLPIHHVSKKSPSRSKTCCRIGVARDEAFHFYYHDNLKVLKEQGAELVYFSPIHDEHLPKDVDALYIGGGYPELFAKQLEENASMRLDIKSFALAGGVIYAECGGLMYLANGLWTMDPSNRENRERFEMCNVLPEIVVTMTPHMKMYYAEILMKENPVFSQGSTCRGQKFHFSEVVEEPSLQSRPFSVTPQHPGAIVEPGGYSVNNVLASYFHLHWASSPSLASDFVASAIQHSPLRCNAFCVSFVSTATEIVFELGAEEKLAGVTSICDYPSHARSFPRQVFCKSPFDASCMTSKEVAAAVEKHKNRVVDGPPGYWIIDKVGLKKASPQVAFVQESCDICDTSKSDVLSALEECGLDSTCKTVQVSPTTLEGMFNSIVTVGKALGIPDESINLCDMLRHRLEVVERKLTERKNQSGPRVLSLEGLSPLCVGGGWLPDIKTAAGCQDALGDVGGSPARVLEWNDVLTADPDVLIISPCSASVSRTLNELYLLNSTEFWKLRCVRDGNVYVMDHSKFSRPGPRLVDAIEMLATILCGIDPPQHTNVETDWKGLVYKYECCVGKVAHCTTELSTRFKPYFGSSKVENITFLSEKTPSSSQDIEQIRVIPCSIPGKHLPCDRSAHNLVALNDGSLLLFGGDDETGRKFDVWKLSAPSIGWNAELDSFDNGVALKPGHSPIWEFLQCPSVADEKVPTGRSNNAAVVCGDYLVVFGGWGNESQCLGNCELLHLGTLCWTHCSTRGVIQPSPRGNPTLVYSKKRNEAILFGGWNKVERLDELWILDMNTWEWKRQLPASSADVWPVGRTDHTSNVLVNSCGNETMVVFGGSTLGQGATSELWFYDLEGMAWTEISCSVNADQWPSARTSHCAAIVGLRKMIVVGGTRNGSGRGAIEADAWILTFQSMTWSRLSWNGSSVERCRHGMIAVDNSKIVIWGGYNGESLIQDGASVWLGRVDVDSAGIVNHSEDNATRERNCLQERWGAEVPIRESDLPDDVLDKARKSSLPGALFKALHRHAVSLQRDTYIDPATGYSVFTQVYLKRRPCCGNGCRHCPYGHVNVQKPKQDENDCDSDEALEW